RTHPVLTAGGPEEGMISIGDEGVLVRAGDQVDGTTVAAVAAARTAARHPHLSAECHAAIAAGAGLNVDVDFVDEHAVDGLPVARPCAARRQTGAPLLAVEPGALFSAAMPLVLRPCAP